MDVTALLHLAEVNNNYQCINHAFLLCFFLFLIISSIMAYMINVSKEKSTRFAKLALTCIEIVTIF